MKAQDLIIGDCVQVKDCIDQSYYFDEYEPGEIVQVREILDNGINPNWAGAEVSSILGLEDIQPIPITPEILEKNGFIMDERDGVAVRYSFATDLHKPKQTVIQFAFYDGGVSADTLFKCWTSPKDCDGINDLHICDLKFVHELQHALHLCGIDKEIEL